MANPVTNANMPTSPLVDAMGDIRPAWRALLLSLFTRTGGPIGKTTPDVDAINNAINDETTARTNADTSLHNQITAEANTRSAADATLAPKSGPVFAGLISLNGATWGAGPGVPAYVAASGSLHTRTDGTVGARLYVSQGGTSWLPVAGV